MTYQEYIEREGEQLAAEQRRARQEEEGEPDEETIRMVAKLNVPNVNETPPERLRRVKRVEELVRGLQDMMLCRPLYGDRACEEIQELLRKYHGPIKTG